VQRRRLGSARAKPLHVGFDHDPARLRAMGLEARRRRSPSARAPEPLREGTDGIPERRGRGAIGCRAAPLAEPRPKNRQIVGVAHGWSYLFASEFENSRAAWSHTNAPWRRKTRVSIVAYAY
jgi:hypothetical protein